MNVSVPSPFFPPFCWCELKCKVQRAWCWDLLHQNEQMYHRFSLVQSDLLFEQMFVWLSAKPHPFPKEFSKAKPVGSFWDPGARNFPFVTEALFVTFWSHGTLKTIVYGVFYEKNIEHFLFGFCFCDLVLKILYMARGQCPILLFSFHNCKMLLV